MDAPRRWQVASAVTALASLGLGGMLLGRPSVESVEPIVLELLGSQPGGGAPAGQDGSGVDLAEDATIVPPIVLQDLPTPASTPSPEEPAAPDPDAGASTGGASTSSGGPTAPSPSPAPTPAPEVADSPASVASDDSLDSDG
jgi:hypothetical protein